MLAIVNQAVDLAALCTVSSVLQIRVLIRQSRIPRNPVIRMHCSMLMRLVGSTPLIKLFPRWRDHQCVILSKTEYILRIYLCSLIVEEEANKTPDRKSGPK
ncbi:hypothetical protein OUZ56_005683 [Daphnia magna]|uniref:Secreted protein n=1 Tax=Daphnia magna TaxID=35525 RepID=A0ABQ9YTH9_9CRUS|nr:hypothetical protein OUZ56_005683 [Daphnia magna]